MALLMMVSVGFALQLAGTLCIGGVIGIAAVRAFRSHRLSFSLLCAWLLVAIQVGAAPVLSAVLQKPAARLGVTQTGLLLGLMVCSILVSLFQVSLDVSRVRRQLIRQIAVEPGTQAGHLTVGQPSERVTSTGARVIVVIPAFNELHSIAPVVRRVSAAGFAALVVDDGSTDGTAVAASAAGAIVLRHRFNGGPGTALRTGLTHAAELGYDYIVQCDADGQHRPEHIDDLLEVATRTGADLVIGSRFAEAGSYAGSMGAVRRSASRFLARSSSRATQATVTDPTSGFRCFTAELAKQAQHMGDHYLADTYEVLVRIGRGGYRVQEVGVPMDTRAGGEASSRGGRLALLTLRTWVLTATRLVPAIDRPQRAR